MQKTAWDGAGDGTDDTQRAHKRGKFSTTVAETTIPSVENAVPTGQQLRLKQPSTAGPASAARHATADNGTHHLSTRDALLDDVTALVLRQA